VASHKALTVAYCFWLAGRDPAGSVLAVSLNNNQASARSRPDCYDRIELRHEPRGLSHRWPACRLVAAAAGDDLAWLS
jgi:hypothetical protein